MVDGRMTQASLVDLHQDGTPELVVGGESLEILELYEGRVVGRISLNLPETEGLSDVREAVAGDLNGDGATDLVVARTTPTDSSANMQDVI